MDPRATGCGCVGADELRAIGEEAGLEIEMLAGGYDLERLTRSASAPSLVARKA